VVETSPPERTQGFLFLKGNFGVGLVYGTIILGSGNESSLEGS